ncbi:transmembrane protein, putative (macronuclear) [Tetrahymena thermophila SB210]|uniref:Transmembrane protein, putative n=1 Tax=Tetrahymena thermophila (strain SB210) TaxID=312017 RepID=Q22NQ0_TETTS|nr:transmembrane protein, putative [Tetrahymena thermophila SB210]EAR86735.1 transmembrane protein, putative [Tetrahymena thermophila SB210]|eukprot:XP_001006980.1 transmembrane protein, putative [Tetrahymena thermophila SB210]
MNKFQNVPPPKRRGQTQIKKSNDETIRSKQQKSFTNINQAGVSQLDGNNKNLKLNIAVADNTTSATIKTVHMQCFLDIQQTDQKINQKTEQMCQQQINTTQLDSADQNNISQVYDQSVGLVFVLTFLAWIGLGIFSFLSTDSFEKIEQINDLKKDSISSGLYCVFLSAIIVFVLGAIIQYLLFKNSYRTLLFCIIFSVLIIIGLAIFAFYKGYTAVGVLAIIFFVFISLLSLSVAENLNSSAKISELCFLFKIIEKKYIVLLTLFSLLILIEMIYSVFCFINILFSLSNSVDHQGAYIFFAIIFTYISSWVIDTTTSIYDFTISRKCSQWYQQQSMPNVQSDYQQKMVSSPSPLQTEINNNDKNQNQQNTISTFKKATEIQACQQENITTKQNDFIDLEKNESSRKMIQNSQQKSPHNQIKMQQDSETIQEMLKVAFSKIGSICYGNLINQLFNLAYFIVYLILVCTTVIFFITPYIQNIRKYTIQVKIQLCLVRLAYDAKDYCQSLNFTNKIVQVQSYIFFYALWGINEITNINQLFCFTSGFAVGVAIISELNYSKWYFTFLFIIIIFAVTLQASKFIIANFQMIVYSLASYQEIERSQKPKVFSKNYQTIYNVLLQAFKLQKEKLKIQDLY